MLTLPAVLVEHHAHGEAGARLVLFQRAEVVGDALGQHRHHAVGEVDRVAALARFLVERLARRDIGGDIGDGDDDHPAAFVLGVRVGFGPHRVVMVAGVGRVDGDQRQIAQILAPSAKLGLFGGFGLRQHGVGEGVGDAVGMDGDQARHLLGFGIAEPLGDARGLHAGAAAARELEADQLAALGVVGAATRYRPLFQLLAVDGIDDPGATRQRAKDAEHPIGGARELLDGARLIGIVGVGALRRDAREHAVADAGGRTRIALALGHEDAGRGPLLRVPGGGARHELAIPVAGHDLDHRHRRQHSGLHQLAARARDQPVVGHAAQQLLERDAVGALNAEGTRDLPLAGLDVGGLEKIEDLLLGW